MRCILVNNPGPESRLIISEEKIPSYQKEDLLIQVKATAVNRADLLQREGKYPPPSGESLIPGLEVAGEVVAMGSNVKRFKIGDRVYGLVGSGGYAEYCCVNQHLAALIPQSWSFAYAAALPEALVTAHATIFTIGKLKPKETLLIHAAGSGITSIALQMAKIHAANIISTASSDDKMNKAKLSGAQLINYKENDFEEILGECCVDVIVDFIGKDYFPKHLRLLKTQGRLIQIACMQGPLVELNLLLLLQKRLQVSGFVLRSQSLSEKSLLWQSMQKKWGEALLSNHIVPIIDSEFSLKDIELAHARMRSREHFGKIVIHIES
jgi:NADPH2:quinone reductase